MTQVPEYPVNGKKQSRFTNDVAMDGHRTVTLVSTGLQQSGITALPRGGQGRHCEDPYLPTASLTGMASFGMEFGEIRA